MVNQWLVSLLWNFAYQVLRAKFSNIILTRQLSGLSLAFMDVSLLWVYQAQVWPLATLHLLYLPSFLISVTMWCAKILCLLAIFSRMNLPWKEWRTYAFLNYYHYFIRHCATSLLLDEEKGCGLKKKEKRFSSDFDVTEEFDSCLSIGMGFFLRGELREAICSVTVDSGELGACWEGTLLGPVLTTWKQSFFLSPLTKFSVQLLTWRTRWMLCLPLSIVSYTQPTRQKLRLILCLPCLEIMFYS